MALTWVLSSRPSLAFFKVARSSMLSTTSRSIEVPLFSNSWQLLIAWKFLFLNNILKRILDRNNILINSLWMFCTFTKNQQQGAFRGFLVLLAPMVIPGKQYAFKLWIKNLYYYNNIIIRLKERECIDKLLLLLGGTN